MPSVHDLLGQLTGKGWPVPEIGYEIAGSRDAVIASAELAWEAFKPAFLREDEMAGEFAFQEAGWRVEPLSEVLRRPDRYLSLLDELASLTSLVIR